MVDRAKANRVVVGNPVMTEVQMLIRQEVARCELQGLVDSLGRRMRGGIKNSSELILTGVDRFNRDPLFHQKVISVGSVVVAAACAIALASKRENHYYITPEGL